MTANSDAAKVASLRARLENVARARGREFQLVLSDWAIERFLYRLGVSAHASDFVLKGAMLLRLWTGDKGRATWDLDLLGHHRDNVAALEKTMREICAIAVDDGILFDVDTVRGEIIRAGQEEAGVRVRFEARLARARIPMQVDVGFGDVVTPAEAPISYPTLLAQPAPNVLAYPPEAVIAEKMEAMITLGVKNSRMKDFYDVRAVAWTHSFDGHLLVEAIRATFHRRGIDLPREEPVALTREFLEDPTRSGQWRAFLRRGRLAGPETIGDLSNDLRRFLLPLLEAAAGDSGFSMSWLPGGPWVEASHGVEP